MHNSLKVWVSAMAKTRPLTLYQGDTISEAYAVLPLRIPIYLNTQCGNTWTEVWNTWTLFHKYWEPPCIKNLHAWGRI